MGINQQTPQELYSTPEGLEKEIRLADPRLTRLANTSSIGELLLAASEIQAAQTDFTDLSQQSIIFQK